jgi:hypothetical protein
MELLRRQSWIRTDKELANSVEYLKHENKLLRTRLAW